MQLTDTYWQMPSNQAKPLMLAKRPLPELVYEAINVEGIELTFTEVRTLLDRVTVSDRKLSDQ